MTRLFLASCAISLLALAAPACAKLLGFVPPTTTAVVHSSTMRFVLDLVSVLLLSSLISAAYYGWRRAVHKRMHIKTVSTHDKVTTTTTAQTTTTTTTTTTTVPTSPTKATASTSTGPFTTSHDSAFTSAHTRHGTAYSPSPTSASTLDKATTTTTKAASTMLSPRERRATKISDCEFHIFAYFVLWVCGMACVWREFPVIWRTAADGGSFWVPLNAATLWNRSSPLTMSILQHFFYLLQFSFYTSGFAVLLMPDEERRVDHTVFVVHHVVTLSLLATSYYLGWTRAGLVILVLHDISDLFLHAGKYGKFLRSELLAGIAFCAFVATYVLFRLVYYPQIVWSAWYEAHTRQMQGVEHAFFATALTALLVLHVIWAGFIVRSAVRSFKKGTWADARDEVSDAEAVGGDLPASYADALKA